jgi:hypothetical protein
MSGKETFTIRESTQSLSFSVICSEDKASEIVQCVGLPYLLGASGHRNEDGSFVIEITLEQMKQRVSVLSHSQSEIY